MQQLSEKFSLAISILNGPLIGLAAILFLIGVVLADSVIERNIRWLIAYPSWMYQKVEKLLDRFSGMFFLFFFIFVFNSLNLFLGFAAGFLVVLPFILAIWTGLNIGIILRQTIENGSILMLFLNPVALVELPAGWISFSLGIETGMHYFVTNEFSALKPVFMDRIPVFGLIVLPLLAIAGLIESAMIRYLRKKVDDDSQ